MNIELNNDEAQALIKLIDLAVKAGGLQVAQPAFVLAAKIERAALEERAEGKSEE